MALNNLGMGLVYTVKDMASGGLAKISAGITKVTTAARTSAAAIPQALGTITRLTGNMFRGLPTGMQAISANMATLRGQFSGFGAGLQSIATHAGNTMRSLFNLKTAIVGAVTAMGGFKAGFKVIDAAAFEESSLMSMSVMLKDKDAAQAAFAKAKRFADTSPFDTRGTVDAVSSLISSRFGLTDIFQGGLLNDIGNLTAANPGQDISEVTRVFGRLRAGDFGEAFQRLQDFKIGFEDLQDAGLDVRAGGDFTKLDPKQTVEVVRKVIQKRFGGMMDEMQHSWQGVWSTFTSNVDNVFAAIGKAKLPGGISVLDAVKSRVEGLTRRIVDDQGNLTPMAQDFIDKMGRAFGAALTAFDAVKAGVDWLIVNVPKLVQGAKDLVDWFTGSSTSAETLKISLIFLGAVIGTILAPFAAIKLASMAVGTAMWFANAATTAWTIATELLNLLFVATPLGWIALAVGALAVGIYLLVRHWDAVSAAVSNFAQVVWDKLVGAFNAVYQWWQNLSPMGQALLIAFMPFIGVPLLIYEHWGVISEFFTGLWESVKSGFKSLMEWWNRVLAGWDIMGGMIGRVLDAGRNLAASFAQGIKDGWNNVIKSVSGGIKTVMDYMGFSSPTKEGPGRAAGRWAPNLMRMYADGINAGIPAVSEAALGVAEALAVGPAQSGLTPSLTPQGVGSSATHTATGKEALATSQGPATGTQGLGSIIVKLICDGRELAEAIVPILDDHQRLHFVRG